MEPVNDFIKSIPLITRYMFLGCGITTLAANFGLVNSYYLYFDIYQVVRSFEIWRVVTTFLFMGRLGLDFLFLMYFLYKYSSMLEGGMFSGRVADYFYLVLVNSLTILIAGGFLGWPFLTRALIMSIMYIWSRYYPNLDVSFLFGVRFKSIYLPWAFMAFSLLMGGLPLQELLGVVCGHIYYYLSEIYPQVYRKPNYLATPQFISNLFPQQMRPAVPGNNNNNNNGNNRPAGYQWGGGVRLG